MLVGGLALVAQAATMQIGTGLDGSGNPLNAYDQDLNYGVSGGGCSTALVYPLGLWPLDGSAWVPNQVLNQPYGQWISPLDPTTTWEQHAGVTKNFSQAPSTLFTFTRTIPAGFSSISGKFSSDNPGAMFLNGSAAPVVQSPGWSQIPSDTYDWGVWTKFFNVTLNPNQVNTITFEVYNLPGDAPGNPAGLIVAVTAVPDGGLTAMLLGIGMLGLGAIRRKVS